jgi:hypothetical protein
VSFSRFVHAVSSLQNDRLWAVSSLQKAQRGAHGELPAGVAGFVAPHHVTVIGKPATAAFGSDVASAVTLSAAMFMVSAVPSAPIMSMEMISVSVPSPESSESTPQRWPDPLKASIPERSTWVTASLKTRVSLPEPSSRWPETRVGPVKGPGHCFG